MKRLQWADALRGILILLVVLGHSIQFAPGMDAESNHLWNMISSFHVPAFMAISGYLNCSSVEKLALTRERGGGISLAFNYLS